MGEKKRLDEILEVRVPLMKVEDAESEIDKIIKEEEKILLDEIKKKKLEEILLDRNLRIAEKRKKLAELLESKASQSGELDSLVIKGGASQPSANLVSVLLASGADPKKVAEFVKNLSFDDITKLSLLIGSGSGGGGNNILPLLVYALSGKSEEKTSVKELAEAVKAVVGTAKDLSTTSESKQEGGSDLTKVLLEKLFETMTQLNEERLKRIEERTMVDPVQYIKEVIGVAKELGLGAKSTNPELELKMKEFETRTALALEKMRQEYEERKLQREAEDKKWEALTQYILGPVLMSLPNMMEPLMRGLGKASGQIASRTMAHSPAALQNVPAFTIGEEGGKYKLTCPGCGQTYEFSEEEMQKMKEFVCPKCGTVFRFEEVESGGEGESEGSEPREGGGEAD